VKIRVTEVDRISPEPLWALWVQKFLVGLEANPELSARIPGLVQRTPTDLDVVPRAGAAGTAVEARASLVWAK